MPDPLPIVPRWIVWDLTVFMSRFFSAGVNTRPVTSKEAGPEILITAIAAMPGAVDNAQIVSVIDDILMLVLLRNAKVRNYQG